MNLVSEISSRLKSYGQGHDTNELEQSLVYGFEMTRLDLTTGLKRFTTVYTHELYRNMLVMVPGYRILDLQRCRVEKVVPRLEMQFGVKYYIVMRDGIDEEVFVFDTLENRNYVYTHLNELLEKLRRLTPQIQSSTLKLFLQADYTRNNHLNASQLTLLMHRLKITPNHSIQKLLSFIRKQQSSPQINLSQFQTLSKLLSCKLQLKPIFEKYSKTQLNKYQDMLANVMKKKDFHVFLKQEQKVESAVQRLNITDSLFMGRGEKISFFHFSAWVFSNRNIIVGEEQREEEFQEGHPLHHYYCFSSHNTYLSGNQLTSSSKVERYVEDLEEGVRCVELDIHDDGPTPIIKHGYTATKPIKFQQVISAISRFCQTDPQHTPIILSLENHCGVQNKDKVAAILLKHFSQDDTTSGKILLVEGESYPSLSKLRGKIIVKGTGMYRELVEGRRVNEVEEEGEEGDQEEEGEVVGEAKVEATSGGMKRLPVTFLRKKNQFFTRINTLRQTKQHMRRKFNFLLNYMSDLKLPKKSTSKQLLSLTSMLSSGKLGKPPNCWQSISLAQGKITSLITSSPSSLTTHTMKSWIRVYPSGARFDSSNYNPLPMLEVGAQIVALNTQCKSLEMNILREFFGGSRRQRGYQLKPEYLRVQDRKQGAAQKQMDIQIRVISCHNITTNQQQQQIPPITVKIGFFGSQHDTKTNHSGGLLLPFTQTIQGNCFNPIFKHSQTFKCRIRDPFFAFICFMIEECGQAAVPVRFMRPGYRVVSVLDSGMRECGAWILVRVDITQRI